MTYVSAGDGLDGDYVAGLSGIFRCSLKAEEFRFPASHGECTEACGRIYECYRYNSFGYSNCNSSVSCTSSGDPDFTPSSTCSPTNHYLDYRGDDYWEASCVYTGYPTSMYCPLGWGIRYDYNRFEPGCADGRHYPNPTKAYDGYNPELGSPHYHC